MPEVLLSNDDLTVLGPPSTIDLSVDFGPQGDRGSQVFVGNGNPNSINIGQTPLLNDLYINISPGDEYSYLYQFVSEPGGNTWIAVLKMNPVLYSSIKTETFVDGQFQLVIPVSDIVEITGATLTASNFNFQYTIENDKPVASSFTVQSPLLDPDFLVVNLTAVEYDAGWSDLDKEVKLHIFITIV